MLHLFNHMTIPALRPLAESIRNARDPVRKAREVLVEEYRKTGGVCEKDAARSACFEIVRSVAVQSAYEALGPGPLFVRAGEFDAEMADAADACREYLGNGLAHSIIEKYPDALGRPETAARTGLEIEAISPYRFLGSTRTHVAGLGYAVSVRKRYAENQDTYRICSFGQRKAYILADGCGSARFAAIASHLAVREALWKSANGIGRKSICEISEMVAAMLNDPSVRSLGEPGLNTGVTTLLVGLSENGRSRMFKVGDSIPFMSWTDGEAAMLEEISPDREMHTIIGNGNTLVEDAIEENERESGRIILTSDGVTNFLSDAQAEIHRFASLSRDPIIIAERLIRSVLRSHIVWGYSDDATIVVEDSQR